MNTSDAYAQGFADAQKLNAERIKELEESKNKIFDSHEKIVMSLLARIKELEDSLKPKSILKNKKHRQIK